jgi:hypothetical protein
MKKFMAVMLGLSLVIGSATVAFADTPAAADKKESKKKKKDDTTKKEEPKKP